MALADPDRLRAAAADADAVVHLAFDHTAVMAGDFAGAVATDLAVVRAMGETLAGPGKTFIGVGVRRSGDAGRDAAANANPRGVVTRAIDELGVRTILVAIPPGTHSTEDKRGFIPDADQDRPWHRRGRLYRRGRQPLARRPHPGRCRALPAGA